MSVKLKICELIYTLLLTGHLSGPQNYPSDSRGNL